MEHFNIPPPPISPSSSSLGTRNSELCTLFPQPPTPNSQLPSFPHPLPHSALSTQHSALFSPLLELK
uniref:Uncharacterized protein n=1 Tax=Desertifilum tharense IPPAS B-1220 TaxID=1781255 RepID=A0ACD5H342_9CYAN